MKYAVLYLALLLTLGLTGLSLAAAAAVFPLSTEWKRRLLVAEDVLAASLLIGAVFALFAGGVFIVVFIVRAVFA